MMALHIKLADAVSVKTLYGDVRLGVNELTDIMTRDQLNILVPLNSNFILSVAFDQNNILVVVPVDSYLNQKLVLANSPRILLLGENLLSISHSCFHLTVTK